MVSSKARHEIQKAALILSRLNDMWSFTGAPLSWKVDRYLSCPATHDRDALLLCVAAYGGLSAAAGEAMEGRNIPDEWQRMFRDIGQSIMFDLPQRFHDLKMVGFEHASAKAFMVGWRGDSLPSLP